MTAIHSVQGPPFTLRLSHWDRRFMPIYSRRLLFFNLKSNSQEQYDIITNIILIALKSTVQVLPFLAGSIIPYSEAQPWLWDIQPEGAAYLEVQDLAGELSMEGLREQGFACDLLDADILCPFPAPFYLTDKPVDVCRLRVSFIKGGLIMVVQIAHTVCDGRGITEAIRVLAREIVKAQGLAVITLISDGNKGGDDVSDEVYSFDRTSLVNGGELEGVIENHPCWTTKPIRPGGGFSTAKFMCRNFYISTKSLQDLKKFVSISTVSETLRLSTHDAVATLLWRSIILARHRAGIIPSESTIHFATVIDCRRHLNLPSPYFGNAIYGVKISLPVSELASLNTGLQTAARLLRTQINNTTGETFRDLIAFVEHTDTQVLTRIGVLEDLTEDTVMLVSYFGFEMHSLDFGGAFGGQIEAIRLPSRGLVPGIPVILPRLKDGSCEVVSNERTDVMEFLEEDELFRRFIKRVC